jgi:hypothetical protein
MTSDAIGTALREGLTEDLLVELLLAGDDYDEEKRANVQRQERFENLRKAVAKLFSPVVERLLADRTAEVEHWVTRFNEVEAWRAQTSALHLKSEARAAEAERRLRELEQAATKRAAAYGSSANPVSGC